MYIADFKRKSSKTTVRDLLREKTRGTHSYIDALYTNLPLSRPDEYRRFLQAHAAATPACETMIMRAGAADLLPDWEQRQRTPALLADLADVTGRTCAPPTPNIENTSRAAALGILYVLEGSRLGGAVLAKRVMTSECYICRGATRYLRHGEGEKLWPSFVDFLNASPLANDAADEVVDGALAAFDMYAQAGERTLSVSSERRTLP